MGPLALLRSPGLLWSLPFVSAVKQTRFVANLAPSRPPPAMVARNAETWIEFVSSGKNSPKSIPPANTLPIVTSAKKSLAKHPRSLRDGIAKLTKTRNSATVPQTMPAKSTNPPRRLRALGRRSRFTSTILRLSVGLVDVSLLGNFALVLVVLRHPGVFKYGRSRSRMNLITGLPGEPFSKKR